MQRLIGVFAVAAAMGLMGLLPSSLNAQPEGPTSPPVPSTTIRSAPEAELAEPHETISPERDGFETLARGPIHESFAKPIDFNASDPVVVPKQPPEPINELPPNAKPEGNAEWISGYWLWDDDRNDFLWVSGTWRVIPRGQRWVAGYWTQNADGYVRVPGFWTTAASTEVRYLPAPPETLEQGPVGEAPSDQHFWIPGCWIYRNVDYSWRPGYWALGNADWMWVPDSYAWTPGGYVYTAGFWDFPYVRRGILFPPLFFTSPTYQNPGYFYSPSIGINLAGLHIHLFARPRYRQFYFGDYYGDNYWNAGFYPWFAFNHWGGYDPFYSYYRIRFGRGDRNWDRRFRDRYRWYNDHRDARPAHTYTALRRQLRDYNTERRDEAEVLVSIRDRDRFDRLTSRRIELLDDNDRRAIAQRTNEQLRGIRERRQEIERDRRITLRPGDDARDGTHSPEVPVLQLPNNDSRERLDNIRERRDEPRKLENRDRELQSREQDQDRRILPPNTDGKNRRESRQREGEDNRERELRNQLGNRPEDPSTPQRERIPFGNDALRPLDEPERPNADRREPPRENNPRRPDMRRENRSPTLDPPVVEPPRVNRPSVPNNPGRVREPIVPRPSTRPQLNPPQVREPVFPPRNIQPQQPVPRTARPEPNVPRGNPVPNIPSPQRPVVPNAPGRVRPQNRPPAEAVRPPSARAAPRKVPARVSNPQRDPQPPAKEREKEKKGD